MNNPCERYGELGRPISSARGAGAGKPAPGDVVRGLVCSTDGHCDSENLVDYHESEAGAVVIVTVTFGMVVIDVLFHDALAVMTPFVDAVAMIWPPVMAITIPIVIAIPVTVRPVMFVAVAVRIPFALVPSIMMSWMVLVFVMVFMVASVPSFAPVMISPSVAA